MKTVRKICPPKIDCWAYENGGCKILTETVCERSLKCGHYKTQAQFDADKKKSCINSLRCRIPSPLRQWYMFRQFRIILILSFLLFLIWKQNSRTNLRAPC